MTDVSSLIGMIADATTATRDRTPTDDAIIAASCASEGAAALLRFAREGQQFPGFALGEGTVEQLAEALALALAIEIPAAERAGLGTDGLDMLGQLLAACTRFIEGYA